MGEPAQPGEDQLTTIVVEGPSRTADKKALDDYRANFEKFKKDMAKLFNDNPTLKIRLRQILYVKKE
jgi:hypothetical protein